MKSASVGLIPQVNRQFPNVSEKCDQMINEMNSSPEVEHSIISDELTVAKNRPSEMDNAFGAV